MEGTEDNQEDCILQSHGNSATLLQNTPSPGLVSNLAARSVPEHEATGGFVQSRQPQTSKPAAIVFRAPSPTMYADHKSKVMMDLSCTATDIRFVLLVMDSLHLSG